MDSHTLLSTTCPPNAHVPTFLFRCLFTGVSEGGRRGDVDEKWHRPTECDQASTSAGKTKPAFQFYNDDVSLPTWQCVAEVPSFSAFPLFFLFSFFFYCLFCSLWFRYQLLFLVIILSVHRKSRAVYVISCAHGTLLLCFIWGKWELVISNLGENYSCSVFLDWNPLIFVISGTSYLHVGLKRNLLRVSLPAFLCSGDMESGCTLGPITC